MAASPSPRAAASDSARPCLDWTPSRAEVEQIMREMRPIIAEFAARARVGLDQASVAGDANSRSSSA